MECSEDSGKREGGRERDVGRGRERIVLRDSFFIAGSYLLSSGFSDFSQGHGSTPPLRLKLDLRSSHWWHR
jgi:hypothetical protein